jgi:hypothetical protein
MPNVAHKLVDIQAILKNEETQSYQEALRSSQHNFLATLHSEAVYQKSICRLLEYSCAPLALTLAATQKNFENQVIHFLVDKQIQMLILSYSWQVCKKNDED